MTDFTGQTFDRYHILESLGEGGMASVYKAYDTRLERDVAVKIIRTDMFVPAALQQVMKRFEREAKSLAKLSHPNIVSIIDYGEHDGVPYLVMEYLPGGTLKDRLKGQPSSWQESIHLLLPIARALQFSHQQGIIHRDVKPSNILITLSGEPMLSDFGIAKILESEGSTALTGTGVGIGTPEYMAPEQWVGNTSPQSDLYSLGIVLYEMVTGRKPFMAETPAAILLKQANDPLPHPRNFVPDLPDEVEKIILKALDKKPENRYSSMEGFINSLEDLVNGQTKVKQSVITLENRKVEEAHPSSQEILAGRLQIGDQPTLYARLPTKGIPLPEIPPSQAAPNGIPFVRIVGIIGIIGICIILFLVGLAVVTPKLFSPVPTAKASTTPLATNNAENANPVLIVTLTTTSLNMKVDGVHLGDPNAPVKVDAYEDFRCPACQHYSQNTALQILKDYVETGKVYYTYHFFIVIDRSDGTDASYRAANAALCASEQNRFWDFHDTLYANQISEDAALFTDARLVTMAENLKLDMTAFNQCYREKRYASIVQSDLSQSQSLNISGVPSLFVNGKLVSDYLQTSQAIDAALAGK